MKNLFSRLAALFMSIALFLSGIFLPADKNPKADVCVRLAQSGFSGVTGESTVLHSDEAVTVNSMVLVEKGSKVKGFTLEALVSGEYVPVTCGDTVNEYRFCAFDSVRSTDFRLTVTDCASNSFEITDIELCTSQRKSEGFRVVSYYVSGSINSGNSLDNGRFLTSTDIIVFGVASFNEHGEIKLVNMKNVSYIMDEVRKINPAVRIHLNLLGPSGEGEDWNAQMRDGCKKHISAMRKNRETFVAGIVSALDEYGFDGVYFDWEYPITLDAKCAFSSFLVALDAALENRELGIAMSSWCCRLTAAARRCIDSVEVMAYDLFDDFGYHSSFTTAYTSVREFLDCGYRKEQLHLGLPFYARPTDAGAYWFNYSDYAGSLGKYGNFCTVTHNGSEFAAYFNSSQLIRDKTEYALASGLGGVMIWHLACDTAYDDELSLYRTISSSLNAE